MRHRAPLEISNLSSQETTRRSRNLTVPYRVHKSLALD